MILDELATYAKKRVEKDVLLKPLDLIKAEAFLLPKGDFVFEKILKENKISLICEVKKASPSKGIISKDFPYVSIAKAYEEAGANCISVLTEPKWFLGSDAIFREIRTQVSIPMLRKDFTIDEYQLYQAKILGADAILLICAILDTPTIKKYLKICDSLGLSALVETHNAEEITSAIAAGARIIGVNNRNLTDFSEDLSTASHLKTKIPSDLIFVAESGIKTPEDGIRLVKDGANALLIGEALMTCDDKKMFIHKIKASQNRTKIKICGLFRPEDISYVNKTLPDFIGFVINFPKSHRSLTKEQTASLKRDLDPNIVSVGVFVNEKPETIQEFVNEKIIDIVQLHGDEDETYLSALRKLIPDVLLWKAFRIQSSKDIASAKNSSADCIILDNGFGTGTSFDWKLISTFKKPMILAGGLTPENIPEAIQLFHPWAIDISSGVELDKVKDYKKIVAAFAATKKRNHTTI